MKYKDIPLLKDMQKFTCDNTNVDDVVAEIEKQMKEAASKGEFKVNCSVKIDKSKTKAIAYLIVSKGYILEASYIDETQTLHMYISWDYEELNNRTKLKGFF